MDGTLLDSRAVVERVWREWAAAHGRDFAPILAESHGRRTIDTVREFAIPGADVEEESRKVEAMEVADVEGIVAIAGAVELISRLGNGRWAVVTSAGRELAVRRLSAAGLPIPEVMITAESVTEGKPEPEGYLKAARLLGVRPEECLVFEDAPAGIEAGRRAGCDVVAITAARPHEFEAGCPEVVDYTRAEFEVG